MIIPSAICTLETFAHSEDQDEMQHNAAFNQGLHVLLRANLQGPKYKMIREFQQVTP